MLFVVSWIDVETSNQHRNRFKSENNEIFFQIGGAIRFFEVTNFHMIREKEETDFFRQFERMI
jgi:hypothetical protein